MWRIWILAAVLSALTALPLQGGEPKIHLAQLRVKLKQMIRQQGNDVRRFGG